MFGECNPLCLGRNFLLLFDAALNFLNFKQHLSTSQWCGMTLNKDHIYKVMVTVHICLKMCPKHNCSLITGPGIYFIYMYIFVNMVKDTM